MMISIQTDWLVHEKKTTIKMLPISQQVSQLEYLGYTAVSD